MILFIAFDGIDGSGKTTLVKRLFDYFDERDKNPNIFDMGSFGFIDDYLKMIKNKEKSVDPKIRELLFYFEGNLFSDYVRENSDKIIITDRYFLSYYAYGPINGICQEEVWKFVHRMISPDFYFFIDVPPEVTLNRIVKYRKIDIPEIGYKNDLSQNEDENRSLYLKVQRKIYSNYKNAISMFDFRVHVINGSRDANQIFDEITSVIEKDN